MRRNYKTQTWYTQSKSNVAKILRSMRVIEDLTQVELSNLIGTTQSGISDMEKGEHSPEITTIFRYAEACGFDVDVTFKRKSGLQIASEFAISSRDLTRE